MKYKIFISANQKELHKEWFAIKEVIMRGLRLYLHVTLCLTHREILSMKQISGIII